MNLRARTLGSFGITLLLIVVVWIWAIFNLDRLGSASDAILRENYRSILAAENMMGALERQDSAILLLMLGYGEEGLEQFQRNEIEFLQWLARARDNITIEGEAEIVGAIEEDYQRFLVNFFRLRDLAITDSTQAPGYYHESVLPQFQLVRDSSIALRELNRQTMVAASQRSNQLAQRAVWSTVVVGAAATLLGLALSLWLSWYLVSPLRAMASAADRIADGDYDVKLDVHSKDEIGQLATKLQTMSYKLKTFHRMNVGQVIEEKRRSDAIIRSIRDGIVVVNIDLEIVAINPEAIRILHVTAQEVIGQHLYDTVKDQQLCEYVRKAAKRGGIPQLDEKDALFTVTQGESTAYYRYAITPVKTEGGSLLGVVLLLQDITKLKELDRLKSDFVATASHELRTPLTSMAMSIDLLLESATPKLTEREQTLLQAASEDVSRLRALVNDLLDLSKIESGRMEMEFDVVTADFLINKALTLFREQAQQQEIELSSDVVDTLPPVQADPNKIVWVLTNLIANALRYTNPGGHIRVRAAAVGDYIHFAVEDDGVGISLAHQSKIFDKFVQVNDNRSVGGSGLGLAICREMVKAHNGTIWVDSQPDVGSTFTFTLPIAGGVKRET
ncbi:MAG: HAMP domain-containing protein [Chloroflexi bacterium]|nr:HAMP domain-containing protein [Chloroflexota bacterium]